MIRDILVDLRQVRPIVDGAVSPAATYGSHVDAVAVGYVSESTAYVMEGGAAPASVIALERERTIGRAEAALGEIKAQTAGICCACRACPTLMSHRRAACQGVARHFDMPMTRRRFRRASARHRPDAMARLALLSQSAGYATI
jgi:hypothetical protein